MDRCRLVAIAVVALPLAVSLAATVESAEGLAGTAFSDAPNVRVYRGIEGHPNYRPSGRSGVRAVRGAPASPRSNVTKPRTPVPGDRLLAAPGARVPYPYWPAWRRTNIPTHCAPRWMC